MGMKTQKLFKDIEMESTKRYMKLVKFLYDNYKPVLREWEATQGNLCVEFADKKRRKK